MVGGRGFPHSGSGSRHREVSPCSLSQCVNTRPGEGGRGRRVIFLGGCHGMVMLAHTWWPKPTHMAPSSCKMMEKWGNGVPGQMHSRGEQALCQLIPFCLCHIPTVCMALAARDLTVLAVKVFTSLKENQLYYPSPHQAGSLNGSSSNLGLFSQNVVFNSHCLENSQNVPAVASRIPSFVLCLIPHVM